MRDRSKSIPSTPSDPNQPSVTHEERKAQVRLLRAAGEISALRTRLWSLYVRLGEHPEDDDMAEGRIPDSISFSVRGAIECTAEDHLAPAIQALEKAARDTPSSLTQEWRRRRQERGE